MTDSIFTMRILVLLLPGLLAAIIVERLTVHPKWEQFRFVLYAAILGCMSYVIFQLGQNILERMCAYTANSEFVPSRLGVWDSLFNSDGRIDPLEVALASLVAVVVGLILSAVIQHKLLFSLASKMHISDKYGDENLFTNILNEKATQYVWVRDNRTDVVYEGRKYAYSEADNVCELVLRDVRVIRAGEKEALYELGKIYLSAAPGELTIEIHNSKEASSD